MGNFICYPQMIDIDAEVLQRPRNLAKVTAREVLEPWPVRLFSTADGLPQRMS